MNFIKLIKEVNLGNWPYL